MPEATDEELGIPEGLDPNIRAELRKSRELARDLEAEKAKSAAAEKEAAFAKAGVPDTPLAAQLAKTYDGENDPASVKAYFESLGVDLSGQAQNQNDGASEAELAEQRRLAEVGSAGGGQGGDVRFEDAINSAKDTDEVMSLIASAPEGATTHAIDGRPRRIGAPVIE
jgi:hypothetical protein